MYQFAEPARSWQEVMDLIQQTPLGRSVLGRALSLCRTGKLAFRPYPRDLRSELLGALSPGCPLGAVFVTDGGQGQIFYDAQGQLGILAPFVFHELIHSLDKRLWLAAGKTLSIQERAALLYSSEQLAFSAQHEFQEGLKKLYPELRAFHRDCYPHLSFLNRAISFEEIRQLYHSIDKIQGKAI